MDNNFDFESKKYIILLLVVCFLFLILVIKAFDYLPAQNINDENMPIKENVVEEQSNGEAGNSQEEIKEETENENKDNIEENQESTKSGVLYKSNDYEINSMFEESEIELPKSQLDDVPPIIEELPNKLSPAEIALKSIINARKYTQVNDYTNAINEYKNAIKNTKDKDILAEVYDGIAQVYILNKNYKTALSFAEKANELSPSFTREFVIAKILYVSGNTGDAINKINKILKSK